VSALWCLCIRGGSLTLKLLLFCGFWIHDAYNAVYTKQTCLVPKLHFNIILPSMNMSNE
jgi:hypothetical protein